MSAVHRVKISLAKLWVVSKGQKPIKLRLQWECKVVLKAFSKSFWCHIISDSILATLDFWQKLRLIFEDFESRIPLRQDQTSTIPSQKVRWKYMQSILRSSAEFGHSSAISCGQILQKLLTHMKKKRSKQLVPKMFQSLPAKVSWFDNFCKIAVFFSWIWKILKN